MPRAHVVSWSGVKWNGTHVSDLSKTPDLFDATPAPCESLDQTCEHRDTEDLRAYVGRLSQRADTIPKWIDKDIGHRALIMSGSLGVHCV